MDLNVRCRQFTLLLYPDDNNHVMALQYIECNYKYAYILHDSDIDDAGGIKKGHWHVVIQFKNARSLLSIVKELGVQPNYIQCCRSYRGALRYLTHKDDDDKYQYCLDSIITNCNDDIYKAYTDKVTEDIAMMFIFDYIDEQEEIDVSSFVRWVLACGYYSFYRRSAYIVNQYIADHNKRIVNNLIRTKQEEINNAIHDKLVQKQNFRQISLDWDNIM